MSCQPAVFDELPSDITCFANDTVKFNCSVSKGDILWFVNGTFALGLPQKLNVSFWTTSRNNGGVVISGENSTLQFIAKPEANNSLIECAVGLANKISSTKATAKLVGELNNACIHSYPG